MVLDPTFGRMGLGQPTMPARPIGSPMRPMPIGTPMRPSFPRSFKNGGKVVRGGAGKLHKGERVVSKFSKAKSVLGGKKNKTRRLIKAAGHELKVSPPKILAKTARKSGAKAAAKQRVAIMLSKARAAGASIPQKS